MSAFRPDRPKAAEPLPAIFLSVRQGDGIDALAELRDVETSEVGNLLLQVQGKATEKDRLPGVDEEQEVAPRYSFDM